MKKCLTCVILSLVLSVSMLAVFACKKEEPAPEYFTLTLQQSIGGTISAILENGEVKEGKYLSGSVVVITATANDGYDFTRMTVHGTNVTATTYKLTITANSTARAYFSKIPLSTITFERLTNAFRNTYDLSDLDSAGGLKGRVVNNIMDQNNIPYEIITDFSISNDLSNNYICTNVKSGAIPLFSVYYIDNGETDSARLYFGMLATSSYLYIDTMSLSEVYELLTMEVPGEETGEPSGGVDTSFLGIEMLETLGVIYDIENTTNSSYFSIDISTLAMFGYELYLSLTEEAEGDMSLLDNMPQIDLAVRVDYIKVGQEERLSDISYTITGVDDGEDGIATSVIRGETEIELSVWNEAPEYPFNASHAIESTLEEIIEVILEMIETITSLS